MITWEHVRFLALLIPTWLLLGAVAITLAVPSQGRASGYSAIESAVQVSLAACRDTGDVAAQQRREELVAASEW
jgi:hypothetical protein